MATCNCHIQAAHYIFDYSWFARRIVSIEVSLHCYCKFKIVNLYVSDSSGIKKWIIRFLQAQYIKEKGNNRKLKYINIKLDNVPQQDNGYDCGRYMLLHYQAILSYFSGDNSFVRNSENNIKTKLSECITKIATKDNIKSLDVKLKQLFSRWTFHYVVILFIHHFNVRLHKQKGGKNNGGAGGDNNNNGSGGGDNNNNIFYLLLSLVLLLLLLLLLLKYY